MGLKYGEVVKVDPDNVMVKVKWFDQDLESFWLQVLGQGSKGSRSYKLPTKGTQVACLMDDNQEDGVVLGSLYSKVDPPPVNSEKKTYMDWEDGAVFQYDEDSHEASLVVPSGGTISLKLGSSELKITEDKITVISSAVEFIKA